MADFAGEFLNLVLSEGALEGDLLSLIQEAPLGGEQLRLCVPSD